MAEKKPEEVALERIEEALRTGATELDLSKLNLSALPMEIGLLINITSLDLSNNQLTFLPAEISQLTKLKKLILGGMFSTNQYATLPVEISRLTNLTSLGTAPQRRTRRTKIQRHPCL